MERDGHGAIHLGPGDLRQVPGVQDEHVSRPLGARGHHDGQEHPCGRPQSNTQGLSHGESALWRRPNLQESLTFYIYFQGI